MILTRAQAFVLRVILFNLREIRVPCSNATIYEKRIEKEGTKFKFFKSQMWIPETTIFSKICTYLYIYITFFVVQKNSSEHFSDGTVSGIILLKRI